MAKISKSQRDMIILGGVLAVTVGVLIWFFAKGSQTPQETYQPKSVDTQIKRELFEMAEFRRLRQPVPLPLEPGAMGRSDPFSAYASTQ